MVARLVPSPAAEHRDGSHGVKPMLLDTLSHTYIAHTIEHLDIYLPYQSQKSAHVTMPSFHSTY